LKINSKSLKELYNLDYDRSGFNSGLILWYNDVIDKSYEQLDARDVSKMLRQNFSDSLNNLAKKRMIDLFIENPYDGEFSDGDLLETIVSCNVTPNDSHKLRELKKVLEAVKTECFEYPGYEDWYDDEERDKYLKNIEIFENLLNL